MSKAMTAHDALVSGKFLTVQFIKKNGEVRTVKARHGVKKYLRKGAVEKHDSTKYVLLWTKPEGSRIYNAPRLINRNKILCIKAEGYEVKTNINSKYAKLIQA